MQRLKLIKHAKGAPGLRVFGLGPNLWPSKGLSKLKLLLDEHAFWASGRSEENLKKLLKGSNVVITVWRGNRIIGFGRATSDGIYRAVLWDIVVADDLQGLGLGKKVVEALLSRPCIKGVERIYLMTTNSSEFYKQFGFENCHHQSLLIKSNWS
ncbi:MULTISPECIES: GNAT family N-acetyltransferase [Prochlorococcus]|uniref:Acetyltransferase n=1 Tax=Prochlorococcus marinus (strain SARG / CCMP1375 / SS120) TaxID=167539 RepID=Q7V9M8_PROMA|nr:MULTISPECIES: GNAT family N-acetyltransferase [Prochlorococcus]AAQ00846.1 Acetyltransferase [Prochlorococcus marinus subsp. marinus str. CCMP1375]KGG10658.1 putative acetyltransferase [Prochlorococcus marinus str. LG]KGG21247.1 putative acetyltransferase [Prochlorococcus marinus str. SS2]KGG23905.1 putative acetyltransferase [Prochlorococcus marinus str. SS35]KGG31836.1 putative acetyltransferase [Prochlorococcus marinus str. SS51]